MIGSQELNFSESTHTFKKSNYEEGNNEWYKGRNGDFKLQECLSASPKSVKNIERWNILIVGLSCIGICQGL